MKKLFVWDLHGVLERGNDKAVTDISNSVLSEFGYSERFCYEDGRNYYGLKWYEYFECLFSEKNHDRDLELQEACFKMSEEQPELQFQWIEPTPHSADVLATIGKTHHQILISNTRRATLDVFVNMLDLGAHFPLGRAFAVDKHSRDASSTKSDVLQEFLNSTSYQQIIIIGDSPSDMRLAEVAGGVTFLYTHPEFPFRDCVSDYRIRDLRTLLEHM